MSTDNLDYVKSQKLSRGLTHVNIAELTEYGADSVASWFASPASERFRGIPNRAVSLMKAKLECRDLRAEVRRLQTELDAKHNAEDTWNLGEGKADSNDKS